MSQQDINTYSSDEYFFTTLFNKWFKHKNVNNNKKNEDNKHVILEKLHKKIQIDYAINTDELLCVICEENKIRVAMIPCGHLTGCIKCIHKALSIKLECITCREYISDVLIIYN